MKTFELPQIEVTKFEMEDVITTSLGDEVGENQTPGRN